MQVSAAKAKKIQDQKRKPKKKMEQSKVSKAMKDNPPPRKKKPLKEEVYVSKRMDNGVSNTRIDVELDPWSYRLPFVAFYADLLRTSIPVQLANSQGTSQPYVVIANAVQYLYEKLLLFIKGGEPVPSLVPQIFNNLAAALRGKTVRTASGATITYAWTIDSTFPANYSNIALGVGEWTTGQPLPDQGGAYEQVAAIVPTASENDYQLLIGLLDGKQCPAYTVVNLDPAASPLRNSVSAFARCYSYNGIAPQGTASGVYKDVELEVPLFNPYLAQFSPYIGERRVPRFLTVGSGDACVPIGLPQIPGWGGHKNRGPIMYKFIDFENVYDTLCAWAAQAKEALIATVDAGYTSSLWTGTFAFSQQDFRIILRQALMAFYDTSYWTQFQGPTRASNNTNYFQPFMVTAATFGAPAFSKMLLPQLIVENLAALKTRVIGANPKNKFVVVPVVGHYVEDTPTVWNYRVVTGTGPDVSTPLFSPLSGNDIRLVDGWDGSIFVNLNGQYYQDLLVNWNAFVEAAQNVSTQICALTGDHGPVGLQALTMTRVCGTPPENPTFDYASLNVDPKYKRGSKTIAPKLAPRPVVKSPVITKYVPNYKVAVKTDDSIKAIPAATSSTLSTEVYTSVGPFSQEAFGLIQNLILPSVRLDPEGSPTLTLPKYQTENMEFVSAQILAQDSAAQAGALGLTTTWYTLAGFCIKGRAGESSQYAAILSLLAEKGHAGMLANILGGLAKTILPPEVGGVVDSIAAVVPI